MTNTNPATMTDTQTARYQQLRTAGHTADVALAAARNMIGASEGKRGPRAPFTQFGRKL
jgi:hypothetical protein